MQESSPRGSTGLTAIRTHTESKLHSKQLRNCLSSLLAADLFAGHNDDGPSNAGKCFEEAPEKLTWYMACRGMPQGISASGSGIFLPAAAARMRSQVEPNSRSTCVRAGA